MAAGGNEKDHAVTTVFAVDEDQYTNYHRQVDANTFLVCLGNVGRVALVDARQGWQQPASLMTVLPPRQTAKTVDTHPTKSELFVCGSSKGSCAIFDIRRATKSKVMTAVEEFEGHTKSVSSAFFSPLTGSKVCTVCYDDRIRFFDVGKGGGAAKLSVAHNNQVRLSLYNDCM
jgi:WD40 repeat protein